jgi:dipeptidyl aminopeptidase/acylaminoacyl peptidase
MFRFKPVVYYLLIPIIFVSIGWFLNTAYHLPKSSKNPIAEVRPTPLLNYSIENLSKTNFETPNIEIGKLIKEYPKFSSYEFSFSFDPTLSNGPKKKVTGLVNIPHGSGPFPLVVMFRGYVDQKLYTTGTGTQHAGEVFANNGYITIAPDFLGYGNSDSESGNIFESRFQTYVTAVTLLKSVNQPSFAKATKGDGRNIFIWGHSNGGQVALTTLEILGISDPDLIGATVLWAPVSKPFPFSILFYTDESDDHGKLIRNELSKFESDYDVEKFSLTNYLDKIKAPIQLNQGTLDDAVPLSWSVLLNKELKSASVSAELIKYPSADHNLTPGWNLAVENALIFFKKHIQ